MASSSSAHLWKYDVFLSFRGSDTQTGFTNHLCKELREQNFETFMDGPELNKGDRIASLLQAIRDSRIVVVICSENYGESSWCLDELVQIFQCQKSNQQIVMPVFYKVNPTDVRHRKGTFGAVFEENEACKEKITEWIGALDQLADSSGFVFPDGLEDEVIGNIVKDIMPSHRVKQKGHIRVKDPLGGFKTACPPAGENRVILYTMMSRGRTQAEWESNEVRKILERFGLKFTEREISKETHHAIELAQLMEWDEWEEETLVPRLFVKGKYIGGVEEVFGLLRFGKLEQIFEGLPKKGDRATICKLCGEVIPDCRVCDGSREMTKLDGGAIIPYRCIYCAGTGLERCYTCW